MCGNLHAPTSAGSGILGCVRSPKRSCQCATTRTGTGGRRSWARRDTVRVVPFVAIPNAARVDIFIDAYHMIMGVAKVSPSPLSGADCLTAATAVFNTTSANLMPSLSDQSSLKSVTVTALDTISSPQAIYAPGNVAG